MDLWTRVGGMALRVSTTLSERLPKGEAGDREFEQIVSVLFSRFVKETNRNEIILPLGRGAWMGGLTACVCYPPSLSPDDFASFLLQHPAFPRLKDEPPAKLPTLLLAFANSVPAREAAKSFFQGVLVAVGWKNVNRLQVVIWDSDYLLSSLVQIPPLYLRYFPEVIPAGENRQKRILDTRSSYSRELAKLHGEIQFVGMSVYKEEASAGVEMEKIYIPLRVIPEVASDSASEALQTDPLTLLAPGSRCVILGDPGSGKSTLLRFLALAGTKPELLRRYKTQKDDRLPILVTLRRYAEELKSNRDLRILDHMIGISQSDLDLPSVDREFLEYFLYAGQALLFFDGIDELPSPEMKAAVRNQIAEILRDYPGNTILTTSRIVGYDTEARFDPLGFRHYLVAKLNLESIEVFIHDWYRARIANKSERERHAQDLARILRDPESRAIRELAENPLLLTIICLVHRIDAELPDERVVLYQKCTETLLNTWHNWKFQRESLPSRNKTEKRNRSRMEAVAHWMHGSLEGKEEARRAVVPFGDLRDFLTGYIEEIERPRGESSLDLAENFLHFVKDRAGLLIEVGSEQYSFVHLTFQEYLTASHLKKSGETAGMPVIWQFLEKHCEDPKWHEVIRLLIGSLERIESQMYLLKRILPEPSEEGAFERMLLAGGCLLDGIDAAEERREEILSGLLFQVAVTDNLERLRKLLRLLKLWQDREHAHKEAIFHVASQAAKVAEDAQRLGLALGLVALGWSDGEIRRITNRLEDLSTREGRVYANCCTDEPTSPNPLWHHKEHDFLQGFLVATSLAGPGANFVSAALAPFFAVSALGSSLPTFNHLLANITGLVEGPFEHFMLNIFFIHSPVLPQKNRDRNRARTRAQDLARALDRVRDRSRARVRALGRTQDLAKALGRARALTRALDQALGHALDRARARSDGWGEVLSNEIFYAPLLDIMCDLLALSPGTQWREALRVRSLPRVPQRITLLHPEIWETTLQRFRQNTPDETAYENAASQLLLDSWLWLTLFYEKPRESPFAELASLTRDIDSAPLRVAHCLRDLAHGDESRVPDLEGMVNSESPEYRKLFEDAFWIDPERPTKKPRAKKRNQG